MTIFYTAFRKEKLGEYEEMLDEYNSKIRQMLAGKIKARKMPELIFKYDESLAYGNHIEDVLNSINK